MNFLRKEDYVIIKIHNLRWSKKLRRTYKKAKKVIFVNYLYRENQIDKFGKKEKTFLTQFPRACVLQLPYMDDLNCCSFLYALQFMIEKNSLIKFNFHPDTTIGVYDSKDLDFYIKYILDNYQPKKVYVPNKIYYHFIDVFNFFRKNVNEKYSGRLVVNNENVKPYNYLLCNKNKDIEINDTFIIYGLKDIKFSKYKLDYLISNHYGLGDINNLSKFL